MIDFELDQLRQNPEWQLLLAAYRDAEPADKSDSDEQDVWMPRLSQVEGVTGERLPRIHGKLIALGYLLFQLEGRGRGVCYRASREGGRALDQLDQSGDGASVTDAQVA